MRNVIDEKTKLAVAVASLKDSSKTANQIADEFGISVGSVRRFRSQFSDQAVQAMRTRVAKQKSKIDRRGYKGRNGRVALHDRIYNKFGIDTDAAKLFEEVNKAGTRRGLSPISKSSFYAMLSAARSMHKAA